MKRFYIVSAILALSASSLMAGVHDVKRAHFATKKAQKENVLNQAAAPAAPVSRAVPTKKLPIIILTEAAQAPEEGNFSFTMDFSFDKGTFTITPNNEEKTYYYMLLTKADADQIIADYTGEGDAINDYMCKYVSEDIKFKNMTAELFGTDPVTFECDYASKGTVSSSADVVPSTDYVLYATYMTYNEDEQVCVAESAPSSASTRSADLTPSENKVNVSVNGTNLVITTTNDDTYGIYIFKTDEIEEFKEYHEFTTNEELFTYYVEDSWYIYSGNQTLSIEEIMPDFFTSNGNYTVFYAPFYQPSKQLWGELKSTTFDFTAPPAKEYHFTCIGGQAAYWEMASTEGSEFFTLTLFNDWDEDGWLLPPYAEFDIYAAVTDDLAGTYSDEDFNLLAETSYAELEDYFHLDFKSGSLTLVYNEKTEDGNAEYLVSGEFIVPNMSGDKFIIDECPVWFYAYNIDTDEQIKLNPKSAIKTISADDNAPAEYFNLQGIRVDNPTDAGIYIVRRGNKAQKVIVR